MRWAIAPLLAALLFVGSGWLDALERTTQAAAELSRSSRSAPEETRAAAEGVASLPAIEMLTKQQADSFEVLVDALGVSAQRVEDLNATIDEQETSLGDLRDTLDGFEGPIGCVRKRLARLVRISGAIPPALADIGTTIGDLRRQQERSIRHLRSINRKLTAFGVVATATDVKPPPPPDAAAPPEPGNARAGDPC